MDKMTNKEIINNLCYLIENELKRIDLKKLDNKKYLKEINKKLDFYFILNNNTEYDLKIKITKK